jgi:hypothetical protein
LPVAGAIRLGLRSGPALARLEPATGGAQALSAAAPDPRRFGKAAAVKFSSSSWPLDGGRDDEQE